MCVIKSGDTIIFRELRFRPNRTAGGAWCDASGRRVISRRASSVCSRHRGRVFPCGAGSRLPAHPTALCPARVGCHSPIVSGADACHTRSMRAKAKRAKSRTAAGQCARQHEQPYGYAAAMLGLHERAVDRPGETARSAVHCQHCLPYRRGRPTEGSGALSEGWTGG